MVGASVGVTGAVVAAAGCVLAAGDELVDCDADGLPPPQAVREIATATPMVASKRDLTKYPPLECVSSVGRYGSSLPRVRSIHQWLSQSQCQACLIRNLDREIAQMAD